MSQDDTDSQTATKTFGSVWTDCLRCGATGIIADDHACAACSGTGQQVTGVYCCRRCGLHTPDNPTCNHCQQALAANTFDD